MNNSENTKRWLLIRGLGRGSAHWMDFPNKLQDRLSDKIITLDLPGNSSLNKNLSPANIKEMTEFYREQLNPTSQESPINIIAISLGGMVTLDWLNRYPEEINQAFVINSSNGAFSSPPLRFRQDAIFPLLWGRARGKENAEKAIISQTCNLVDSELVAPHFIREAYHQPVSSKNMLRQIYAASKFSLRSLDHPDKLNLICSEQDRLVTAACSKAMAIYWNVPLSVHPTAGHDLPLDDPDWLIEEIIKTVR